MITLFQNMVALSLQIGVLIGIVLLFSRHLKKSYQIAGRYFLWLVFAFRLLIPVNMGWFQLEHFTSVSEEFVTEKKVEQSINEELAKTWQANLDSEQRQQTQNTSQKQVCIQDTKVSPKQNEFADVNMLFEKCDDTEHGSTTTKENSNVVMKWYREYEDVLWNLGCFIWIVGVFIMTAYEILRYQSVYRSIRRWQRSVPEEYTQVMEQVKKEMHISKKIPVYQCRNVCSPMIVGLRKSVIFLPEKIYDKESLYFIYKHELTHLCHGDLYYKCVQTITRCVYWFQPVVHIMYRQATFDVELFCDERVTKDKSREFCQAYSFVLLDTLTEQNVRAFPISTCFMNGGKKQMKERFIRIMNEKKTKYGIVIFGGLMVCALLLGNISFSLAHVEGKDVKQNSKVTQCTGIKHILVVGEENLQDGVFSRADLNLLITLNMDTETFFVTDLERDLAVSYKGQKYKLSNLYAEHGIVGTKKAVEDMAGISIDGTVAVNFERFEKVIDSIGGLKISLTKKEAKYLNQTNYIREKKYRNVTAGTQVLNGQQVLGFVRIRRVVSANGKNSSFGRGERAMEVVSAMKQAVVEMDEVQWMETAKTVYDLVDISGLQLSDVYGMASEILSKSYTCVTQQVPELTKQKDGSWKESFEQVQDDEIGVYMQYDFAESESFANIRGDVE